MSLSVIIMPECASQAQKYNQHSALLKVKENIERFQNLAGFERLSSSNFLKRPLSNNYRLFAYTKNFDDCALVVFLRIVKRSDSEYLTLLETIKRDSEDSLKRVFRLNHEDLTTMYEELKQKQEIRELPKPTEQERRWLYEVLVKESKSTFRDEIMVFESFDWIQDIKSEKNLQHIKDIHRLLEDNIDKLEISSDDTDIKVLSHKDRYGLYRIYYVFRPELKKLYLLKPVVSETETPDSATTIRKLNEAEEMPQFQNKFYRAYPMLLLLEFNLWRDIQNDEEANLALSPEESELLNSLTEWGEKFSGFPLFINGRAGSGKSTMLQYLTAEYLYYALRNDLSDKILYMTYSFDLLQRAKDVVKSLINLNYERIIHERIPEQKVEQRLSQTFVVFNQFLLSLLDESDKVKFSPEKYVNYPKFKKLWEEQFSKRADSKGLSIEIAWHTIRTYIKGMRTSYEDDFGPEEFEALPKKRKTVSQKLFNEIYNKVWIGWYKKLCFEEGYWDEQDLATWVFERGLANDVNAVAIFCDEAQDFTSIELRVILQLSLFSKRKLTSEELQRVPIAFAGDPLQTINPTGFSWEATKDEFHNVFSEILDPHRTKRLIINFKDLSYNYRSNPGIVKFCNTIQLLRYHFLGNKDIRPQQSWWEEEPVVVGVFHEESQIVEGLKNRPELVILVNCEPDEEYEFVNNDLILKELKKEKEFERVYQNVLSPMRAKGLEFQEVVLYRFIEGFWENISRLTSGKIDMDDVEDKLPFEYFFNRLYVAASRAKKDLCIVDSKEAVDKFWHRYFNQADNLLSIVQNKEEWEAKICSTLTSDNKWWNRERISPEAVAFEFEQEGRKKQDPFYLIQAYHNYMLVSRKAKANECLAEANYLEGNYLKAGEIFLSLGNIERAFDCFWRAKSWEKIIEISHQEKSLSGKNQALAAKLILSPADQIDSMEINRILSLFENQSFFSEALRDSTWIEFLREFSEKLLTPTLIDKINLHRLYLIYSRFTEKGVHFKPEVMANFAYEAGDLLNAVKYWELTPKRDNPKYRLAKAKTTAFPENIHWYGLLKEYDEIVKVYNQNKSRLSQMRLDDTTQNYIVSALIEKSDYENALSLLKNKPSREHLRTILEHSIEVDNHSMILEALRIYMRLLIKSHEFERVKDTVEKLEIQLFPEKESKRISEKLSKSLNYTEFLKIVSQEFSLIDPREFSSIFDSFIEKGEYLLPLFILRFYRHRDKFFLNILWQTSIDKRDATIAEEVLKVFIIYLISEKKWENLIDFLSSQNIYKLIPDEFETLPSLVSEKINVSNLIHFCLVSLATLSAFEDESNLYKEKFTDFLRSKYLYKDVLDFGSVSPKVIGVLFEKTGRFTVSIAFYKNLLNRKLSESETRFYFSRLAKVHLENAEYFREKNDERKALDHTEKANEIMKRFSIQLEELEGFPLLTLNDLKQRESKDEERRRMISSVVSKSKPLAERFIFIPLKENRKIRIKNIEDSLICTIDLCADDPKRAIKGEVDFEIIDSKGVGSITWRIPEWNVKVSLKRVDNYVSIELEDDGGDKTVERFAVKD